MSFKRDIALFMHMPFMYSCGFNPKHPLNCSLNAFGLIRHICARASTFIYGTWTDNPRRCGLSYNAQGFQSGTGVYAPVILIIQIPRDAQ